MSKHSPGSVYSYTIGFVLSLVLTFIPYLTVTQGNFSKWLTGFILATCAVLQVFVQLVFFLHLGQEKRPRWKTMSLGFAVMVLLILVFGSLWIMNNLNYNMMSPSETKSYIEHEEGISR